MQCPKCKAEIEQLEVTRTISAKVSLCEGKVAWDDEDTEQECYSCLNCGGIIISLYDIIDDEGNELSESLAQRVLKFMEGPK